MIFDLFLNLLTILGYVVLVCLFIAVTTFIGSVTWLFCSSIVRAFRKTLNKEDKNE